MRGRSDDACFFPQTGCYSHPPDLRIAPISPSVSSENVSMLKHPMHGIISETEKACARQT